MSINVDILNTLIKNQRDAIKYQAIFASIVVILGCCLIIISNFLLQTKTTSEPIKLLLNLGGGFISTISSYPINQIIFRKEKIKTYQIFKFKIDEMTDEETKKVEDLIWKSIEKII